MTFDPYAELGVSREATAPQIQRAARMRAKRTHPDAGGSVDAFDRTRRALLVLIDPERRRTFDETGRVEEEKPDNVRATALQILDAFIGQAIEGFLGGNGMVADPRGRDLFGEFRRKMEQEIAEAVEGMGNGRQIRAFVEDLAGRIKGTDPAQSVEKMLEFRVRHVDAQLAKAEEAVAVRRAAIEVSKSYAMEGAGEVYVAPGVTINVSVS